MDLKANAVRDFQGLDKSEEDCRLSKKERNGGDIDTSNPVKLQFKNYAKILDERHDQHERLVKISRDITIESKRIIFLLHRIQGHGDENILSEASKRLEEIRQNQWQRVANEVQKMDQPLQFFRAFTAGLQEYIEALSFYQFIKFGTILSWSQMTEYLTFPLPEFKNTSEAAVQPSKDDRINCVQIPVPKFDFLLGLADLTGELMRRAVSSAATGHTEISFSIFGTLLELYSYFDILDGILNNSGFNRKVKVLEQSLRKVERVCYHIQIRVGEIPQDLIGHYIKLTAVNDREDDNQFENL